MLLHGNCLEQLKTLPDNSIDSIVTDPPYGLSFMGKKWDYDVPSIAIWQECLRVLKPGGHLLSFGGTRTYHRLVVNIEDAGFEIRDCIQWLYGSGFPKSTDVSKRIDKEAGATREVLGTRKTNDIRGSSVDGEYRPLSKNKPQMDFAITAPSTDSAKQWQGWGTALKPAFEPVVMARKPLTRASVLTTLALECQSKLFAEIAARYLTSSLSAETRQSIAQWNVGKSTPTPEALSEVMVTLQSKSAENSYLSTELSWLSILDGICTHANTCTTEMESSLITDLKILKSLLSSNTQSSMRQNGGPGEPLSASLVANLLSALELKLNYIHTVFAHDPATSSDDLSKSLLGDRTANEPICVARKPLEKGLTVAENVLKWGTGALNIDASRIVTEEKLGRLNSSTSTFNHKNTTPLVDNSRGLGRWPANIILDEEVATLMPVENKQSVSRFFYVAKASKRERGEGNNHPTVKPTKLMEYLIKLVTPPNGTVLDPFMGSGSTGVAAKKLGFKFVGCEMNEEYFEISNERIKGELNV